MAAYMSTQRSGASLVRTRTDRLRRALLTLAAALLPCLLGAGFAHADDEVEGSGGWRVVQTLDTDKNGIADITVYDTDGDGIGDYVEGDLDGDGTIDFSTTDPQYIANIDAETDPARQDSDDDGLTDAEEYHTGSNIFQSDSDGDGISDGPETARQNELTDGTGPDYGEGGGDDAYPAYDDEVDTPQADDATDDLGGYPTGDDSAGGFGDEASEE